jgi:hypothetical protein
MNASLKRKIHAGTRKIKSNSVTQSFLNERFEAFVDFPSCTGNETTLLWF